MTVRVDPVSMTAFTEDALDALRRLHVDLDDTRTAAAKVDALPAARAVGAVLAEADALLADLRRLVVWPAHLAAAFVQLDTTAAEAERPVVAALETVGGRSSRNDPDRYVATLGHLSPAAVADLWAGLPARDRVRLTIEHRSTIGRLAGVPLPVRDRANRALLHDHLAGLRAHLATVDTGPVDLTGDAPWDPDPGRTALQARITRLETMLDADRIIAFDPSGDGRAVVALGDPATARHVATIVPGIDTTLDAMPRLMREAAALRDAARRVDDDVATIAWLDYEAPPGPFEVGTGLLAGNVLPLVDVATRLRAEHDQQALVDHAEMVRVVNRAGHHTVVGHSYGSVLAFRALKPGGTDVPLDVDDVVAVGSPGAGTDVEHLSDLAPPDGVGVWTATGPADPVPLVPAVLGPSIDDLGPDVNTLPTDWANVGHARYFVAGSAALGAMAAVVAGRSLRAPSRASEVRARRD